MMPVLYRVAQNEVEHLIFICTVYHARVVTLKQREAPLGPSTTPCITLQVRSRPL